MALIGMFRLAFEIVFGVTNFFIGLIPSRLLDFVTGIPRVAAIGLHNLPFLYLGKIDRMIHYSHGGDLVTAIQPPEPRRRKHLRKKEGWGLTYPAEDETKIFPNPQVIFIGDLLGFIARLFCVDRILTEYRARGWCLDSTALFSNPKESDEWRQSVYGSVWPEMYTGIFKEITSDHGVSLFCFNGPMAHTIKKEVDREREFPEIRYSLDVTLFESFETRRPFCQYGAKAFFDENKELTSIYVSYMQEEIRPYEQQWNHAKFVLKCSIVTQATMYEHLGRVHLMMGNFGCAAAREELPHDHKLRLFLTPHMFLTATTNLKAPILLDYIGLFHMAWGFTEDSVYSVGAVTEKNYTFQKFVDRIDKKMRDEGPENFAVNDVIELDQIITTYVSNVLRYLYPTNKRLQEDRFARGFYENVAAKLSAPPNFTLDNLITLVSEFILSASGIHQHVGIQMQYDERCDWIGTRFQRGQTEQDVQSFALKAALLVATTGEEPKLMDDYSFIFEDVTMRKAHQKFCEELDRYSAVVDERNVNREVSFLSFYPRILGCSVSV